ncbi:hypothetical protein C3E78_02365 [Aeromicrobium chenweiae]|uniref:Uncharacterized protein n=1 Tax=Aeromicrobium chenweiae TaxID=2079793 RepID=A0A2S0WII8_9ACTN|nr:hypothetical protein C3E78_02365 [Aeromicrobium chenweiae]
MDPEERDPVVVFLESAFWIVAGIAMIGGVTFVVTFFLTCWWMPSWGYFVATSMVVVVAAFVWLAGGSENFRARFDKPLGYVAGALLVTAAVASLIIPPPTSSKPDGGEDEAVVYTDADCGGLLGFARRDDITSVEKANALDEYSANC